MTQPIPNMQRPVGVLEGLASRVPEPAQLYFLAVTHLKLHVPDDQCVSVVEVCAVCRKPWPCNPVRLAFRSLEAF